MEKLKMLEDLFEAAVKSAGVELYHMEYVREEGVNILRFYIDSENGITLEDCEKVSKAVGEILDEKDPIVEDYNLEVSSPGIFRPLFTMKHMEEAIGEQVLVKTKKPVNGSKNTKGILKNVNEEKIILLCGKEEVEILMGNLRTINIEVDL
jgi:ribosome maturation factor RimP